MVGGKFEASLGALLCCGVVVLCWERCCVGNVVVLLCCCVQQKLMTKETKLETFLKFRLSVLFKVSFV